MTWLFADDLKILFSNLNFHGDLWRLHSWNLFNGMVANSLKTKCIHFKGSADILFPPDVKLENVTNHKDLSILMHNDLNWSFHVKTKLQKAVKTKIPFNTPALTKLGLYRTLVLSVLLYGISAWYPDSTSLRKLENFQRSCSRWIFGQKLIIP